MRIIKPYGRSVVNQLEETRKRQIDIGGRATQTGESVQDILPYQQNNADFFISQWTSMLDKLLRKPYKQGVKPADRTYEAREAARKGFLCYWENNQDKSYIPHQVTDEAFIRKWKNKVHPYKEDQDKKHQESEDKQPDDITKRWYKKFTDNNDQASLNRPETWESIAEKIYVHLYEQQQKLHTDKTRKQGLVVARAESIEHNIRQYETNNGKLISRSSRSSNEQQYIDAVQNGTIFKDWGDCKTAYKLGELVADLKQQEQQTLDKKRESEKEAQENKSKSKPNNNRLPEGKMPYLFRDQAIGSLYTHYAKIFTANDKPLGIDEAKNQKPELWQYHCMIRQALYQRYPKRLHPAKRKKGLHPVNTDKLHRLATAIETNKQMAFAIRLGKVIHYQSGIDLALSDDKQEIVASQYWTSQGQTTIKQNESFVRQWLGAIAIANTTFERLVDPERTINGDFIGDSSAFNKARKQLAQQPDHIAADFDNQFKLLFGDKHGLYEDNEQRDQLVTALQFTLAQLRHASFHFKKIDDFTIALDAAKTTPKKHANDRVATYIKHQQSIQQTFILSELESAGVEQHLQQEQLTQLLNLIQNKERNLLPLPKFNKLLNRDNNTDKQLIKPANKQAMNGKADAIQAMESKTYRCCFISLKMLYERDFGDWLKKQEHNASEINAWIDAAKQRTTKAAQQINENHTLPDQTVLSKMERLRNYRQGKPIETLTDYFAYLTAETASEFMVQQNIYQSNQQAAKDQSNFVEELKQDTLIRAFKTYLVKTRLDFLLSPNRLPTNQNSTITDTTTMPTEIKRTWFYMVLHMMPCEFINHLALEIKKHHVLTQEQNHAEIYRAISLFLDVHNAELGIKSLSDNNKLADFYEYRQEFKNVFEQAILDDKQNQLIPVRGLREILRYGNLQQLEKLFTNNKVEASSIENLKAQQQGDAHSSIALAQQQREILHAKLVKSKQTISDEDAKTYQICLNSITTYRRLKNHVYLHNQKQAHQLIMEISARLLGFSQLWERDIYFVLLALLFLRNIKKNPSALPLGAITNIEKGQIIRAIDTLAKTNDEAIQAIVANIQKLFSINQSKNGFSNRDIRNKLAHFNHIRSDESDELINFTQTINQVRRIMRYDRKNKNAVSKAIIDLLERYNLIITFKTNNHQLEFDKLTTKKIYHLKTKTTAPIAEKLHDTAYVGVIKQLFNGSTNGNKANKTTR